jgi:hypothetical protein
MSYPAVIFWVLVLGSLRASHGTLLAFLLASISFSSLALLPTEATFGMSILPQMMVAVVLICKVLAPEVVNLSPKLLTALQLRNLGWLGLFLLVGSMTTLIMPRLFAGEVIIVPMRETGGGVDLLHPTPQSFTQTGYVTLSIMTVFAVMLMADKAGFIRALLASLLAGGIVCLVTGLIDMAAASAGMQDLLKPFRTAEYAFLTNAETASAGRRVVGLTPEASVYGPLCVQFGAALALLRTLYATWVQRALATLVAISLLAMAVLSTSSTAFGGLAVFAMIYAADWVRRAIVSTSVNQGRLIWELFVGLGLGIVALFVLLTRAEALNPLLNLIDEVLFRKAESSSFYERSFWNSTAWNTVSSTWGLGIGFGSTRTSNWFAAIISNSGILGTTLIGIFLLQTFVRRPDWRNSSSADLLTPLKLSLVPALVMAGVAAPGPDFGPWIAVVLGAITGIAAFDQSPVFVDKIPARSKSSRQTPKGVIVQTPR